MKIAATVARILLGLLFTFAAGCMFLTTPPPEPGIAGTFDDIFFHSHWVLFVASAQLVSGVLLLVNRYVPVALIILAGFLYNSFSFHITIAPSGLFAPIIVTPLWLVVSLRYREAFAPLFVAKPSVLGAT